MNTLENRPVLIILGTRPEAIKLAPLPAALRLAGFNDVRLCSTGQHREMLHQVFELFGLKPDYDLNLMQPGQALPDFMAKCLTGVTNVLKEVKPSVVVVQGDTTTVLAASLAAYYAQIPVAHVEAGLRTGQKYLPFPEEMNRVIASDLAEFHFAPTEWARNNLLREGKNPQRVWLTGNTVIDALRIVVDKVGTAACPPGLDAGFALRVEKWRVTKRRMILVTGHRRESFGEGFKNISLALCDIAARNPEVEVVYPVHLNPNVHGPVKAIIGSQQRVHLLEPLAYGAFTWLMQRAFLILTDSGGVQEEAPALGKPVLVMRESTERPEAVAAGTAKIVGTSRECIVHETERLLQNPIDYAKMAQASNPYGDGNAARRIAEILALEYKNG